MANEVPVMQNSKMLVLSLVLAAVVVVLYNVHINQVRNEGKDKLVKLLQYKLSRHAGEQISEKDDFNIVEVTQKEADGLRSVKREGADFTSKTLARPVSTGDWVMLDDFAGAREDRGIGHKLDPGDVLVVLPVDPLHSQGRALRFGDRVNILGEIRNKDGKYEYVHIIDGLTIFGIGGKIVSDVRKPTEEEGSTSYKDVEVPMKADMSMQMYNVLTHLRGQQVIIEIRNRTVNGDNDGKFNPDMGDKLKTTSTNRGTSGTGFGPPAAPEPVPLGS